MVDRPNQRDLARSQGPEKSLERPRGKLSYPTTKRLEKTHPEREEKERDESRPRSKFGYFRVG